MSDCASGVEAAIALVLGRVVRGISVEVKIGPGVSAVGAAVAGGHRPVAQLGHLPANGLAADIARAGKLPGDRSTALRHLLVDVPDLDRFLSRLGSRVAIGEIHSIQVPRHGVAHRQLELEQVIKGQAQAFRAALVTGVCNQVCEQIDEDKYSALPEWMRNDGGRHEAGRWDELRKLIKDHLAAIENGGDGRDFWDSLNDRLSEADDISYVEQARMFMGEHHEVLGLGCDYWEIIIDKPRDSLINRLYLINHAAKAIVAQQGEVKAA